MTAASKNPRHPARHAGNSNIPPERFDGWDRRRRAADPRGTTLVENDDPSSLAYRSRRSGNETYQPRERDTTSEDRCWSSRRTVLVWPGTADDTPPRTLSLLRYYYYYFIVRSLSQPCNTVVIATCGRSARFVRNRFYDRRRRRRWRRKPLLLRARRDAATKVTPPDRLGRTVRGVKVTGYGGRRTRHRCRVDDGHGTGVCTVRLVGVCASVRGENVL